MSHIREQERSLRTVSINNVRANKPDFAGSGT